jgi:hypothetical protein
MSSSPATGPSVELIKYTARIDQDRAYVHALRDGHVISDPRVGPAATFDWVAGVHAGQLQRLGERSERSGTHG